MCYKDKHESLSYFLSEADMGEIMSSHPCYVSTTRWELIFKPHGSAHHTLGGYLAAAQDFCTSSFLTVQSVFTFPGSATTSHHVPVHHVSIHQVSDRESGISRTMHPPMSFLTMAVPERFTYNWECKPFELQEQSWRELVRSCQQENIESKLAPKDFGSGMYADN